MRSPRAVLAAALATLCAVTGAVLLGQGSASAATASLTIVNSWSNGYQAEFRVGNDTAGSISSWKVEFDLPAGSTVSQSWSTRATVSGSHYSFANETWNGTLGAGASTTFGFLVNGTGRPANCLVNGGSCTGLGTTPSPTPSPTGSPTPTPTPTQTTPPPPGTTVVAQHGQLHVCGTTMCDKNNARVQLKGISSMWLNWETQPYAENLQALTWMRDNWNLQVIRAAMGVEPDGAYLTNPTKARAQVEQIITNAVTAGVYVIVDWHAHEAYRNTQAAVSFFGDLAQRYGNLPNVIWEPWNEPLQLDWNTVLKPYHQAVVQAIRAQDPDNIIVLGTPTWSQDVDKAAASPLTGTNLMYTLHFYSCTHTSALRAKADTAIRAGLALFVTEWGSSNADGGLDGRSCNTEAQTWIDWMATNGISWAAWKLDVGSDTTNLLSPGAPVTGGWTNYLHGHAAFVVQNMR
jgi:endoglucanase